jgi:hypothetical protein
VVQLFLLGEVKLAVMQAGRRLEEAVVQSTEIGAVNSWLRNQPAQVISAAVAATH